MSSSCSLTDRLSNNSVKTVYAPQCSGFSLGHLHMGGGGICPPMTSATGQSVNGGGPHEGGHRPYGVGPKSYRLYHKLKVLLLLSCKLHDAICRLQFY